ncbi:heat-inducible transcriptional repressor HrcA [Desulfovibrio inopinatus]|uniref:heat-inducible transcriptional repressor HrcA n=1 Tax=Desulfovibrio inopinatus TaxID=102109 RepID=UPI000400D0B2|nr:heat-inducible transcriptional repressor HrcA [Desulfovibrio inopinatus]
MTLTERELIVLHSIVDTYIADAQPVGSRTVAKTCPLKLSAASIRNIMADLTDKDYLAQPHTSAGRVPTARAFRLYLDEIMKQRPLSNLEKERIMIALGKAGLEIGDILRQASRVLSDTSLQVGMVIAPRHTNIRWRRIEFELIKPGLIVVMLILQGGIVKKQVIAVEKDITSNDLVKFGNYLNYLFQNMTVAEARGRIVAELNGAKRELDRLCHKALTLALLTFEEDEEPEVYVEGRANILAQPEFSDATAMRELLCILEEHNTLLQILDTTVREYKTAVVIGEESHLDEFSVLGIIAAPYGPESAPLGTVGLIGPVRMDYCRLVPMVHYTARTLTQLLTKHF